MLEHQLQELGLRGSPGVPEAQGILKGTLKGIPKLKRNPERESMNIGAFIIRVGFWCILYYFHFQAFRGVRGLITTCRGFGNVLAAGTRSKTLIIL